MFGRKIRYIAVLMAIFALIFAFVFPGQANPLEQRIQQSQEKLSRIQQTIEDRHKQLAEYQNEEKRLLSQLQDINYSLNMLRRELSRLEKDIEETENNIQVTEQELAEAEEQIELRNEHLKKRLRAIYEKGETGYLEVLFSSTSFAEFLTRLNDLKLIAENDLRLLEEAFYERALIQEKKEQLEKEKARLLQMRVERLNRREELNRTLVSRESLLAEVQETIEAHERAIQELEQESEKLESLIKQLSEELRRQTERFAPSGQLLWPLEEFGRSWITSGFGPRTHPITGRPGVFHGGIDIGIPHYRWPGSSSYNGNPVYIRAAERGIVSFAGVFGSLSYGYGKTVIIEHGKNLTTVYAHCHSLLVSAGEEVSRGQPIAIVGSTGSSTGPHLHFEVRVNGERKNPLDFF